MRKFLILLCAMIFPLIVLAQDVAEISEEVEDDRGFLTRLLEKNLSGAGRTVVIDGFAGALSSRATFEQITIADDDGVWLTLRDGAIHWNRKALLLKRVEIQELSATEILLPRLPGGGEETPTAEATEFALPELPVSLSIEKIDVGRIELGEPVIGIEAAISASGSMSLAGGEGLASLDVQRLDGPRGEFVLDASYSNESRILGINLSLDEAADGLLVNLVDLYDKPAVTAQISGEGPLDGFAADLRLATDGQPRVTGRVSLSAADSEDGRPGRDFRIELGGDVGALLPPEDRTFFGPKTELLAEGWAGQTGAIEVPVFMLDTDALNLSGSLVLNDQRAPESAVLLMTLGRDAGASEVPVSLPSAGENTTVESGRLELQYDAADGQGWRLTGRVGQLDQGGVRIGALTLDGQGNIVLADGALRDATGRIEFGAAELSFVDPGLARAVGEKISGAADFEFGQGGVLEIRDLSISGADYGLDGYALLSGLSGGILASLDLEARYQDLSRLSTLAGRDISGQADASITGNYTVLTKGFDIDATVSGTDISIDQPQLDRLLAGNSQISLDARRDTSGITLEDLSVDAQGLTASAAGYLNSNSSDLTARIAMPSLAEADPQYGGSLQVDARLTGPSGARQLSVSGDAEDLRLGIEALDGALQGNTTLALIAGQTDGSYQVESFQLSNPQIRAEGQGVFAADQLDGTAQLSIPDLAAIKADWSGGLDVEARLSETDGTRFVDVTGTGQDLSLGQKGVEGALTGATDLKVQAEEKDGVITLRDVRLTNDQLSATAKGVYGAGVTDVTADVDIRSLAPFGEGWRGALVAQGSFRETGDGARRLEIAGTGQDLALGQAQIDGALAGETRLAVTGTERDGVFTIEQARVENPRLEASATGTVGGDATDLSTSLNAQDLRFLGSGIGGSLSAEVQLTQQAGVRRIAASGTANGLSVGQPRLDPVLRGQTSFDITAAQSPDGISIQQLVVNNPQLALTVSGDPASGLNVDGRLSDLGLVLPQFPGPVELDGTIAETGANFVVDLAASAPGPTRVSVSGTAARNFSTANLQISGSSDSAIANSVLRTRSVEGPVNFDLNLNGAPSVEALSGQVQLSNAVLSDPRLGIRLENLNLTAALQNGLIQLSGGGDIAAGGRISLEGPVDLRAGTIDLEVDLDRVVAQDPNLYRTIISGEVDVTGRQADGPLISGRIELGETEILIPSTGLGGAKAIPDIEHVGDTRPMRSTRAKAGLEPYPGQASREAGLAGPPATPPVNPPRLDLQIDAPRQIFIRGRGVDAEMGGSLRIEGTTRNVIPIGNLELIRGRVDLLGKRFDLTEGLVELQGSLIPILRLVAQTTQDGVTTYIIIDGEARDPEITFESSPEMPEEEVLSQLLFGRGLSDISPLQAAQLANALAVLAGRGGEGIVSKLRNQVGLDDLDLQTDDDGNVEVRAGKYLSDNLYTDVSVGNTGKSTINLNLDITESLRARGSVDSDGDSAIGIYFERDY